MLAHLYTLVYVRSGVWEKGKVDRVAEIRRRRRCAGCIPQTLCSSTRRKMNAIVIKKWGGK